MKKYIAFILSIHILIGYTTLYSQNTQNQFTLSKHISVKKDPTSCLYVLFSKKNKVLDTLSYVKGDSLFDFKIDTLTAKKNLIIVLKYKLINNLIEKNCSKDVSAKRFVVVNLTKQQVTFSLLSNFTYHQTTYHNYSYPSDAESVEESYFECAFTYKILSEKSMELISIRTSGVLGGNYLYLKDYLSYRKGMEGIYVLKENKLVKQN